nr:imidazole glycerol phosphate synthase subunit HisH [Actinomyces bowdenii]
MRRCAAGCRPRSRLRRVKAPRVVVLAYGSGNVRSAVRALERVGAQVDLTADPQAVVRAEGLVVPGVGAFEAVMDQLRAVDAPRLIERRLAGGRPVLGICVGMQVMFESSQEHGSTCPGLGQWPGTVTRLEAEVVPHMGWSTVRPAAQSALFRGVEEERFYFVHSYAATTDPAELLDAGPMRPPLATWATHGQDFLAAVENGPLCATQFHPEKSGDAGAQLLRNWLTTL